MVELVGKERYTLGEGPYYDPRFKRLSWVDIPEKKLWIMGVDQKKQAIELPQKAGAAVPLADSEGFLLALEDGLYLYEDGELRRHTELGDVYKSYWRSNDAKADALGRLWFGASVDDGIHEDEGNLYTLIDGKPVIAVTGTKISNGMAWNKDKTKFYFSDSPKQAVFVYDYAEENGKLSNEKVLFAVSDGVSDGLTIDAEDNLWIAFWGGSRIEKRDGRTGVLLETIPVPAKQVTSCCFGDEDMMTLYITTAGIGQDGEYDGCLFAYRTDVKGVTPDYFRYKTV